MRSELIVPFVRLTAARPVVAYSTCSEETSSDHNRHRAEADEIAKECCSEWMKKHDMLRTVPIVESAMLKANTNSQKRETRKR